MEQKPPEKGPRKAWEETRNSVTEREIKNPNAGRKKRSILFT
jgi:hypothetical protein